MKPLHTFLLLALTATAAAAQPTPTASLLDSVLASNPALRTARLRLEASGAARREQLRLPDPEADASYMWGSPDGVPGRTNVSLTQQLPASLLSGSMRRWTRTAAAADLADYRLLRRQVAGQTREVLIELVYLARWCAELSERSALASHVTQLMEQRQGAGAAARAELSKARLSAAVIHAEWHRTQAERADRLLTLAQLCGGTPPAFADTTYARVGVDPTLSLLPAASLSNPQGTSALLRAEAQVAQAHSALRLARTAGWPALRVGFMGEYVRRNNYSGLSLGFSLPLWGGSRAKVRTARTLLSLSEQEQDEQRQQYLGDVERARATAFQLERSALGLTRSIDQADNRSMLRQQLEAGDLSLLDYLLEQEFYYNARQQQLQAQRDAMLARARLQTLLE